MTAHLPRLPPPPGPWYEQGLCRGMGRNPHDNPWFPVRGADHRPAKQACEACPVREPCLEYAMDNGIQYGIWGGFSERGRRALRRHRRGQAA